MDGVAIEVSSNDWKNIIFIVIASEAKQSPKDCFVVSLLAMKV